MSKFNPTFVASCGREITLLEIIWVTILLLWRVTYYLVIAALIVLGVYVAINFIAILFVLMLFGAILSYKPS